MPIVIESIQTTCEFKNEGFKQHLRSFSHFKCHFTFWRTFLSIIITILVCLFTYLWQNIESTCLNNSLLIYIL